MSIAEKFAAKLLERIPEAELDIDTANRSISFTLDDVNWTISVTNRNNQSLQRNGHFYMRLRSDWDNSIDSILKEHAKMLERDTHKKTCEALCRYIQDDGSLPENYRVINVASTSNGGIMSISDPSENTITVKTKIDPPLISVTRDGVYTEFSLSDPDCAKHVIEEITR